MTTKLSPRACWGSPKALEDVNARWRCCLFGSKTYSLQHSCAKRVQRKRDHSVEGEGHKKLQPTTYHHEAGHEELRPPKPASQIIKGQGTNIINKGRLPDYTTGSQKDPSQTASMSLNSHSAPQRGARSHCIGQGGHEDELNIRRGEEVGHASRRWVGNTTAQSRSKDTTVSLHTPASTNGRVEIGTRAPVQVARSDNTCDTLTKASDCRSRGDMK